MIKFRITFTLICILYMYPEKNPHITVSNSNVAHSWFLLGSNIHVHKDNVVVNWISNKSVTNVFFHVDRFDNTEILGDLVHMQFYKDLRRTRPSGSVSNSMTFFMKFVSVRILHLLGILEYYIGNILTSSVKRKLRPPYN